MIINVKKRFVTRKVFIKMMIQKSTIQNIVNVEKRYIFTNIPKSGKFCNPKDCLMAKKMRYPNVSNLAKCDIR